TFARYLTLSRRHLLRAIYRLTTATLCGIPAIPYTPAYRTIRLYNATLYAYITTPHTPAYRIITHVSSVPYRCLSTDRLAISFANIAPPFRSVCSSNIIFIPVTFRR